MIMKKGEHLTSEGLKAIMNIRASINRGLTPTLKEAFPDYVPVHRPLVDAQKLLLFILIELQDLLPVMVLLWLN